MGSMTSPEFSRVHSSRGSRPPLPPYEVGGERSGRWRDAVYELGEACTGGWA